MPIDAQSFGAYPGRGLVHLVDADGSVWWLYFITGRSPASRARRVAVSGSDLLIESTDVDVADDPLRHYACLRPIDGGVVVGNGDHVEVLADRLRNGEPLGAIVDAIEPEPDAPIFTPRIALVLDDRSRSVAVCQDGDRVVRRIEQIERTPQVATVLTTYSGPIDSPRGDAPSFALSEQRRISELAQGIFKEALPATLTVLLVAGPAHPGSDHPDDWLRRFPS